jgi:hypothetical protein
MKSIALMVGALALVLVVGPIPAISQDKAGGKTEAKEEEKEMPEMDPPGENHKVLARFVGKWQLDMKMWMGPEATEHSVEAEWTSEMGGRFVRQQYEMADGTMDHKGILWMGYDNMRKKFREMQLMSISTMMNVYEGDYDAESKKLTLSTTWPMTWQGQTMEYTTNHIYHFESDDRIKFTVMSKVKGSDGDFKKEVEGVYTRKK